MLNSRQGKTPPSSSAAGMVLLRRRTGQPSDALEKLFGTIVFRRVAAHSGARLGRRKPARVQAMTGGMNMDEHGVR